MSPADGIAHGHHVMSGIKHSLATLQPAYQVAQSAATAGTAGAAAALAPVVIAVGVAALIGWGIYEATKD